MSDLPLILLTPDDVAAILRTTRKAIYAMVERGTLPASTIRRIGRRILFHRAELLQWLNTTAAAPSER